MLDFNGYIANNTCFAAANTYYGFKSNFDEVLERDTLERLFILKGGPGTGKSSLMKAVIKYANHEGIYAEELLPLRPPAAGPDYAPRLPPGCTARSAPGSADGAVPP